jgi:hypothetical protein
METSADELAQHHAQRQLTITEAIEDLSHPENSSAIVFPPAQTSFSSRPPTFNSTAAAVRIIPPLGWMNDAVKAHDAEKASGARSIIDLYTKGVRHSPSIIGIWERVTAQNVARNTWTQSQHWLDSVKTQFPHLSIHADEARDLMHELPCDGRLAVAGMAVDTLPLARVLSNKMINDDFINGYMVYLARRAHRGLDSKVRPGVLLTTSYLYRIIENEVKAGKGHVHVVHNAIRQTMSAGQHTTLGFPIFYEKHCFAVVLDLNKKALLEGERTILP